MKQIINNSQIERIRQKKRLPITLWQTIKHYWLALFPLIIMGASVMDDPIYLKGKLIWVLPALAFIIFKIQRKKTKFKEFKANCDMKMLLDALRRASNEQGLRIERFESDILQAFFNDPFNYYGGNLITIIKVNNGYLMNSISDPRKMIIPIISAWDKDNYRIYKKHLLDVINKRVENKDYLIPENEWTFNKTVRRILIYIFCILLIIGGVAMILNPAGPRSGFSGVWALIFGFGYIIIDIKLIKKKRKYDAQQTL